MCQVHLKSRWTFGQPAQTQYKTQLHEIMMPYFYYCYEISSHQLDSFIGLVKFNWLDFYWNIFYALSSEEKVCLIGIKSNNLIPPICKLACFYVIQIYKQAYFCLQRCLLAKLKHSMKFKLQQHHRKYWNNQCFNEKILMICIRSEFLS